MFWIFISFLRLEKKYTFSSQNVFVFPVKMEVLDIYRHPCKSVRENQEGTQSQFTVSFRRPYISSYASATSLCAYSKCCGVTANTIFISSPNWFLFAHIKALTFLVALLSIIYITRSFLFQVYDSVLCSIITRPYNHHHNLTSERFHHPERKPQGAAPPHYTLVDFLSLLTRLSWMTQHAVFGGCLLPPGIVFLRFIVVGISTSLLFAA